MKLRVKDSVLVDMRYKGGWRPRPAVVVAIPDNAHARVRMGKLGRGTERSVPLYRLYGKDGKP